MKDSESANDLSIIDRDMGSSDNGESLPVYMKAIQRLPLLTKEEEIKLANQIKDSKRNILELCCNVPECITEFYLLKDLSATNLRKLFLAFLNEKEGDKGEVEKLVKKLEKLVTAAIASKDYKKLLAFIERFNFTFQDLKGLSAPVKEYGSKTQYKKLKQELEIFRISKNKIIEGNLRLVFARAKNFMNRGLSLEDLLQEGNLGLMKAIEKYDVSKGYKFGTYATWWIDQALGRAIADKSRLIRIPVHMVENINKITKAQRNLNQKLGRAPKIEEVSKASKLSKEKIEKVNKLATFPQSVEEPQGEVGIPLSEYLVDTETMDPHQVLERKELAQRVRLLLSKLPPREEKIMRMRFGIGEPKPFILDAIGKENKVTREGARQIIIQNINSLNSIGTEEGLDKDWKETE